MGSSHAVIDVQAIRCAADADDIRAQLMKDLGCNVVRRAMRCIDHDLQPLEREITGKLSEVRKKIAELEAVVPPLPATRELLDALVADAQSKRQASNDAIAEQSSVAGTIDNDAKVRLQLAELERQLGDLPDTGETATAPPASSADLSDFIEASGLLSYDPEAITRIYAGHPQRLIKRLWQTLVPIGLYLLGVSTDWLFGLLNNRERARQRAKEAAELLVDLGPAFIKAGQALSTRPDIVPPLLLEELAGLQDQLPGFDSALAMACIEEDLGAPIASIYAELEREPISAASLGQVHRGVLLNGEKVAVKVQRPGLREQITLDLYIVRNIAAWLNRNIGLIRSDLVALIDELGKRVFEEMDYCNEASNANDSPSTAGVAKACTATESARSLRASTRGSATLPESRCRDTADESMRADSERRCNTRAASPGRSDPRTARRVQGLEASRQYRAASASTEAGVPTAANDWAA